MKTNGSKRISGLVTGLLAAAATILGGEAFGALPAVIEQIPSDANAAVVIRDVKDLSTRINNLATRLSLGQKLHIPVPPDIALFAARYAGIDRGFDFNGSMALVILKPAEAGGDEHPGAVSTIRQSIILLPAKDPKTMTENIVTGDPDSSGISEVQLPGDLPGFVAPSSDNKWVILSMNKETLKGYLKRNAGNNLAKSLAPETAAAFEKNDLIFWANVGGFGTDVEKFLGDRQEGVINMLTLKAFDRGTDPAQEALQKELFTQYYKTAREFFLDAQSATATWRLDDAGITFGLSGTFKPDSPFGKFVTAQKTAKPLSLDGLPGGDYLIAMAFNFDSKSVSELFGGVANSILSNETLAANDKIAGMRQAVAMSQQMLQVSTGGNLVFLAPPPDAKTGLFSGAYLLDVTDAAQFKAAQLEMLKNPIIKQSLNPDLVQDVQVTPDAITVKGIKLTRLHISVKLRDETPEKPISASSKANMKVLERVYGADGMTSYTGIVNNRVLVIFGGDEAFLEKAVGAAVANSDELSKNPGIVAVKGHLADNPIAVMYMPITQWVSVAASAAGHPELSEKIVTPDLKKTPPAVLSAGVTGSTLQIDWHMPMNTIGAIIDMIQHAKTTAMPDGDAPPATPPAEGGQ